MEQEICDTLYIRLGRDAFIFATYDRMKQHTLNYVTFKVKPDVSVNANMHEALACVPLAAMNYRQIRVLVEGPATLVPLSEFDEDSLDDFYFFNMPSGRRHRRVFYDTLPHQNAVLVFGIDRDVCHTLEEAFPNVVFQSAETPQLLHFASCSSPALEQGRLYVSISDHRMTVCAFRHGRIELFNTFPLHNEQDALYFSLYTARLWHADPTVDETFVVGRREKARRLSDAIKTYLPNSFVLKAEEEFQGGVPAMQEALPYDFITLLLRAY
jgi:hypothetical protein